jgi:regulator of protease activity HflC (stomatin/prohibitin superfamily)
MSIIILFTVLALVALACSFLLDLPVAGKGALVVLAVSLFVFGFGVGSSVSIGNDEVGIISKRFGTDLPTGHIIARNGERGPQQEILGPGWHFGFIPFLYEVHTEPITNIPPNTVGIVTARDGKALPEGETFAPAWSNVQDMLDAEKFLAGSGFRGPQTTILPPGSYRFNTALFQVRTIPALQVAAGTVAVIKSNTGRLPTDDEIAKWHTPVVNGVALVPRDHRGVWSQPLTPGAYYLNTEAFVPVMVKTTQRSYSYSASSGREISAPSAAQRVVTANGGGYQSWAVSVRTKDGFSFPVDVRMLCAVEAANAPYLVALLGNPDAVVRDDQEEETLETLESKVVLPVIRAVMRNVAESLTALEFVNNRSTIEKTATQQITAELARYKLTCDGVYVGQIHLDVTDAGQKLMATQTDKQVALNQEQLYNQQRQAEVARATLVRATEEAEQQKFLAAAEYKVSIEKQNARSMVERANGEADAARITGKGRADAYKAMVESLGPNAVAQLEMLKLVAEGKVQITPQVMMTGSNGSALDALSGTLLRQVQPPAK